jgi:hypothetical protein
MGEATQWVRVDPGGLSEGRVTTVVAGGMRRQSSDVLAETPGKA